MNATLSPSLRLLLLALLALCGAAGNAAVAPLSPEQLVARSTHQFTGTVLSVRSKLRPAQVEKAPGLHRDRVYRIRIRVTAVERGDGLAAGDEVEVVTWRSALRVPPLPGHQGQNHIPGRGDTVTVFADGREGEAYTPLLPNGLSVAPAAPAETR